jgi:manganese-dependent inorganic pyrophosphatase
MEKLYVFGHKCPDSDSICSAIAFADFMKKTGREDVKAFRLGEINKETEYAINYFGVELPELLEKVEEGQVVALVDHNEFDQSIEGIEKAKIERVIDHHRIANFKTSEPLYYYAEPVGCTATILYGLYVRNGIEIESKIAGLLLSAIISDTLLLKSPTCTKIDEDAAYDLAKIANVDINKYGLDMLKAGTDLDGFTEDELVRLDTKNTEKDGVKYSVGQVNTVSIPDVLKREEKIKEAMNKYIEEKQIELFVLAITDIVESNSEIIALGNRVDIIEKSVKLEDNKALLEGVVSRKKQILPMIEKNI